MIQPRRFNDDYEYPVMEHFYTLQGEGMHTGTPAYFIRLAGCNVGCTWCDVKESWTVSENQYLSLATLVNQVKKSGSKIVVLTGGEPAMYNLEPMSQALKKNKCKVHIETSGAYSLSGDLDWICLSPKRFKPPLPESLMRADELKMIVVNKHDLEWGVDLMKTTKSTCVGLLQPEWDRMDKVLPFVLSFLKKYPHWRLSLQTHKYLNIP